MVVFDLDGCLWDPEMYMLSWRGGAPFEPDGDAMLSQSGEAWSWCREEDTAAAEDDGRLERKK